MVRNSFTRVSFESPLIKDTEKDAMIEDNH